MVVEEGVLMGANCARQEGELSQVVEAVAKNSPWVEEEEVMRVEVVEGEAEAVVEVEKCTSNQTSSLVSSNYVIDRVKR